MNQFDLFEPTDDRRPKANAIDADSPEAKAILTELRRKPQACDHIADSIGYPLDTVRKVVGALHRAGHIVDNGDRTKTKTYEHSIVWHPTKP